MQYSSSKHGAGPADNFSQMTANTPSSNIRYKKDGGPDIRCRSSKQEEHGTVSGSKPVIQQKSYGIPDHVPKEKDGTPDMRTRAAKDWVDSKASECGTSALPALVPRKKDGFVDFTTGTQQQQSYRIPDHVSKKKDGTPDMRTRAAKDWEAGQASPLSFAPKTSRFIFPTVFNANIRGGFRKKIDELRDVLHQNFVDIACITETWLNQFIDDYQTHIPGYRTFRRDRSDGRQGGGVAILARKGLTCAILNIPKSTKQETLWLLCREPCMSRVQTHILIGCVYFPPNANAERMNGHLLSILNAVRRKRPNLPILLVGDFNRLCDHRLLSCSLKQIVKYPTRGLAVLDKIYTNVSDWFSDPINLPAVGNSDHCSVLLRPTTKPPLLKCTSV